MGRVRENGNESTRKREECGGTEKKPLGIRKRVKKRRGKHDQMGRMKENGEDSMREWVKYGKRENQSG